ncbi:MAG: plasmid mobilization relaxosome protein MobC [Oscillospiraceae bacterium]
MSLLRRTSANVNQIAKRVNSTGRVYENDLAEIQNRLGEVWLAMDDVLRKLAIID